MSRVLTHIHLFLNYHTVGWTTITTKKINKTWREKETPPPVLTVPKMHTSIPVSLKSGEKGMEGDDKKLHVMALEKTDICR